MEEKKGYNVLKLVMHGNKCYVSTDYVRGKPMIQWLKYHPDISKDQFYNWIMEILYNLDCFHQCQGMPAYQYVNPYSIIISEEGKIYLLDIGYKGNEELLHVMQRKVIREHFLSPENQYYQKANVKEDIYGWGKTIQYLTASVEINPSLSKREEYKLRKIISKCLNQKSKKSYQTVREISLHFPKRKQNRKSEKNIYKIKSIVYGLGLCLMIACNITLMVLLEKKSTQIAEVQAAPKIVETKVEVVQKPLEGEEKEAIYDLAFLYLLDYEEYEKSKEIFALLEGDTLAEMHVKLIEHLQNDNLSEEALLELLKQIESGGGDYKDPKLYLGLIKGYEKVHAEDEEGNKERLRLCEYCLYEADMSEVIFWASKEYDVDFRLAIIKAQCGDAEVERSSCAETIKKMLEEVPEIAETEEFIQLQQEYEIIIEEDNVTVGK